MKRLLLDQLRAFQQAHRSLALVTRLADGAQALVCCNESRGDLELNLEQLKQVRQLLLNNRSASLAGEGLFVRSYSPPLRLIIVGAVHISQLLAPMAALAGFDVVVVDPRQAFADAQRFPGTELRAQWPEQAFTELHPDERTAVVTFTHDPKIDDPALCAALQSPAFYVGALGSRRTHAARLERLREQVPGADLTRIHAPIGLNLGGREPGEIAVAALAQIIEQRNREVMP